MKLPNKSQNIAAFMRSIKSLLTGLVAVSFCMGAISGRVTDTSGIAAISGAVVQLEIGGQQDTTDENGNFTIPVGSGIISRISKASVNYLLATIVGGFLRVNIAEKIDVEIAIYDLSGKMLLRVRQKMEAGTHFFTLPYTGSGIYMYSVKANGKEVLLMGSKIGKAARGAGLSTELSLSKTALAEQVKAVAAINDVIAVTKNGYLNYRVIVKNSDTTGIAIKMIASAGTMTDADGNVYQTVKIGNQIWTTENLKTTKFNDGTPIPLVTDQIAWSSVTTPGYCFYNNTTTPSEQQKWGALYNWYTVNTGKLAPSGWHVPSDAEWDTLLFYLIANGYNYDRTTTGNKIAKSLAARTDWSGSIDQGAIGNDASSNNSSGFSALPGSYRIDSGLFLNNQRTCGYWWSATEYIGLIAWYRNLYYYYDYLYRLDISKNHGFSVRLVRDN